jgi:hypothetical protein
MYAAKFLEAYLFIEPCWVPGYPLSLAGDTAPLSHEWVTFVAVVASRLGRVRSTLTAMDSHVRIDSDRSNKFFKADIALELHALSSKCMHALQHIALYLESPYSHAPPDLGPGPDPGGWRGATSMRAILVATLQDLKVYIEKFVATVNLQVIKFNGVKDNERESAANSNATPAAAADGEPARGAPLRRRGADDAARAGAGAGTRYQPDRTAARSRLGDTLDAWHKIYPMRSFCTLSVQMAVQTSSLLSETIKFIGVVYEYDSSRPPQSHEYKDLNPNNNFQVSDTGEITAEELLENAMRPLALEPADPAYAPSSHVASSASSGGRASEPAGMANPMHTHTHGTTRGVEMSAVRSLVPDHI